MFSRKVGCLLFILKMFSADVVVAFLLRFAAYIGCN
jgi:hypothetical protein